MDILYILPVTCAIGLGILAFASSKQSYAVLLWGLLASQSLSWTIWGAQLLLMLFFLLARSAREIAE